MNILSISHYDMDGFGCQFSIYEKFKNHNTRFENCGYESIKKTLNSFDFNNFDVVFITDLNFNGSDLKLLYEKMQTSKSKVVYIDHHLYEDEDIAIFEKLKGDNFKYKIDTNHSASMLTYKLLKIDNPKLFNLIKIIDIFDIWQTDKKEFLFSKYLNEWFWFNSDVFFSKMINADYDFTKYLDEIKKMKIEIDSYYKNNLNKDFFYDDEYDIFLSGKYIYTSFIQDYFKNVKLAIIVNSKDGKTGRISIRDNIEARNDIEKYCKENNIEFGGHGTAYGMTINSSKKTIKEVTDDLIQIGRDILDAPF